jgi:hypothetical protein
MALTCATWLVRQDDPLGNLTIRLNDLPRDRVVERWYRLKDVETGRICLALKAVDFGGMH